MNEPKTITVTVNDKIVEMVVPAHRTLLEALRHEGFVEIKCGCEKGDCGACAVLLDGEPVDSCLTLAWHAEGREVTTIKGIGQPGNADPLQKTFIETGASQCGYCTPGMIVAAKSLLKKNPNPSLNDIKRGLSGNLCRCTGYTRIFEAVQLAAEELHAEGESA
ncbi:MAG: (2Fe-2S)-binding protein [Acidiferrobacteraceae bacterium]|nr:(2Fe-2S)-binding protein [Acidiferrobacteraceae bacterium]